MALGWESCLRSLFKGIVPIHDLITSQRPHPSKYHHIGNQDLTHEFWGDRQSNPMKFLKVQTTKIISAMFWLFFYCINCPRSFVQAHELLPNFRWILEKASAICFVRGLGHCSECWEITRVHCNALQMSGRWLRLLAEIQGRKPAVVIRILCLCRKQLEL